MSQIVIRTETSMVEGLANNKSGRLEPYRGVNEYMDCHNGIRIVCG